MRRRIYVIGIVSAALIAAAIGGGILYIQWLQLIVERITD
jgi:hypothetical protein